MLFWSHSRKIAFSIKCFLIESHANFRHSLDRGSKERLGISAEDLTEEGRPGGDDESPTVFTETSDGGSVCIRLRPWLWDGSVLCRSDDLSLDLQNMHRNQTQQPECLQFQHAYRKGDTETGELPETHRSASLDCDTAKRLCMTQSKAEGDDRHPTVVFRLPHGA